MTTCFLDIETTGLRKGITGLHFAVGPVCFECDPDKTVSEGVRNPYCPHQARWCKGCGHPKRFPCPTVLLLVPEASTGETTGSGS